MQHREPVLSLGRCRRLLFAVIFVAMAAWGGGIKLRVTAEQANIREKPDIMSAILQQLPMGATFEAERKEGEWFALLVEKEEGGTTLGYVHESLVMVMEESPAAPPRGEEKSGEKPPAAAEPPAKGREAGSLPPQAPRVPAERTDKISTVFWLGGRRASASDLNDGAQGLADYYETRLAASPGNEVQAVHFGYLFGAEVRIPLASGFFVSLGAAYSSGEAASSVIFKGGSSEGSYSAKPGYRTASIGLAVLYYPLRLLYVRGGIDYAFARCSYFYRYSQPQPSEPAEFWQQWTGRASSSGFGYLLGIGFEWPLGRRLALVAEAALRSEALGGLEGEDLYQESSGYESREKGALYYIRAAAGGTETLPLVFVRDKEPSEAGVVDARKAELELSGYTLRLGLQVRF